jgi:hypothetical protein
MKISNELRECLNRITFGVEIRTRTKLIWNIDTKCIDDVRIFVENQKLRGFPPDKFDELMDAAIRSNDGLHLSGEWLVCLPNPHCSTYVKGVMGITGANREGSSSDSLVVRVDAYLIPDLPVNAELERLVMEYPIKTKML